MKFKKVSIIIPYYRSYLYLIGCIMNLVRNTEYPEYEIIIVNDGSPDFNLVKEFIEDVKLHYNVELNYIDRKENKLFAYTSNEGADHAKGEYLHFLNADTIPFKGWLKSLVEFYEKNENVGIVGSMLIYPELNLIQHIGGAINGALNPFHLYLFTEPELPFILKKRKVLHSTAASMFIAKKDFIKIGGFDDKKIKHTFEDTDLCFKLRIKLGKEIWVEPKSKLYHYENVTGRTTSHSIKSLRIFKNRWKNHLKPNSMEVYASDGFEPEFLRFLFGVNIFNFNFIYYLIKKFKLNTPEKQIKFIREDGALGKIKTFLNNSIKTGIFPIVTETNILTLLRENLISKENTKFILKKYTKFVEKKDFFVNLYNLASLYILRGEYKKGKNVLELIIEYKDHIESDIAGKAFFKLSETTLDREEKKYYLNKTLEIIPDHKMAKKRLEELSFYEQ